MSPPKQKELAVSVRQKMLLDYSVFMAKYIPLESSSSPAQSLAHSTDSSPSAASKVPSNPLEEEPEAWVNALLGRIFWDFLGEKYWSDIVSKKIQMKLSKIRLPYFMNELTLTELDMGVAVPKILQASKPSIDHQGKVRPRTYCLADSDEESSSAGSSDEEDPPDLPAGDKALALGAEGRATAPSLYPSGENVILLCVQYGQGLQGDEQCSCSGNTVTLPETLLFVSTLDGSLHAVSKRTGSINWTLKEAGLWPRLVTLFVIDRPAFLPDPNDGSLYSLGGKNNEGLLKLPFTIPELVQASPCRSSDGILYMEYTITMYDTKNKELRWNATYFDYASTLPDEDTEYKMSHFVSNGDGLVVTVDPESGDVLWIQKYNSPVVAMYIWQREGLRKVAHTNMGVETLRYLTFMSGEVGRITKWKYPFPKETKAKNKLMATLYVGKYSSSLYASPSLVHDGVTVVPRGSAFPLLEGPKTAGVTIGDQEECFITPSTDVKFSTAGLKETDRINYMRNHWLLIGHHETPPAAHTKILEKFPENIPRHPENVIPTGAEKNKEEASGGRTGGVFMF
ncbi:UNVERIFIED_CONTAM: hypothetical protein FKN15_070303 [Acipenser sinensis]